VIAVLLVFTHKASGQLVDRKVLIEEATNWGCLPCKDLNPNIETVVTAHPSNFIQISYHTGWPGPDDPLFHNDSKNSNIRVGSYYKISTVPSISIDGSAPFTPSSSSFIEREYQARLRKKSPISLKVKRSVLDTTVTVSVTVKAVGDVSAYRQLVLQVVAVEREFDQAGPNGEKKYVFPMRTMLPTADGTPLSLQQGDSLTFTFTYPLKPTYVAKNMYEVAFVQSDSTHEVLQTETSLPESPDLVLSENSRVITRTPTPIVFNIKNPTDGNVLLHVEYQRKEGGEWPVAINGSPTSLEVYIDANSGGSIFVTADPGVGAYTSGDLIVKDVTGKVLSTWRIKFIAPEVHTAYLDLTNSSTIMGLLLEGSDVITEPFVPLDEAEATAFGAWNPQEFDHIIAATGKNALSIDSRQSIEQYLASGGKLLLHGGEIAFALADARSNASDTSSVFLSKILHASYIADSAGPRTIRGKYADDVTGNFVGERDLYARNVEANQPDEILAIDGAIPIFTYGSSNKIAALRWSDSSAKLVFCAFGLENLSIADANTVVDNSLAWFNNVKVVVPGELKFDLLSPNPLFLNSQASQLKIYYGIPNPGIIAVELRTTDGRLLYHTEISNSLAGFYQYVIDLPPLASGAYFMQLIHNGRTVTKGFSVLR